MMNDMRLQRTAKTIFDEQTFNAEFVTFDAIKKEWKLWLNYGEENWIKKKYTPKKASLKI